MPEHSHVAEYEHWLLLYMTCLLKEIPGLLR
jgi:hypothetical protein